MRFPGTEHRCRRGVRRGPAGHTMIEVLLSVAIIATLMSVMAVSLAIASRALDSGAGPGGQTRRAGEVIEEIDADLALALSFTERTATAVTFTVPDRDGDSNPETLRYSWTGSPENELLRQVNGGVAVTIAEDVQHFNLTYRLKIVDP